MSNQTTVQSGVSIADIFKWFHQHPELSFEEYNTTGRIRDLLEEAEIEILDLPLETGLVARIVGGKPGPVIAVRCDIDALPIDEESGLPYASTVPGKMHACGHDFHTTAILFAAYQLKQRQSELAGTVKVIFQPGEESSLGALKIVESGALADVSLIFGIHTDIHFPVGTFGIKAGSVTAAVDKFELVFEGKGTHAAHPQNGIDPIVIAAQFITAAQTVVSRNIDPFAQGLVSVTHITGGNTWNVIPTSAFLEGTVRSIQPEVRKLIPERLQELADHIAAGFRAKANFTWIEGPPATDNDPEWADFARQIAQAGGHAVAVPFDSLGGEDFAFYQQTIPGVFIKVGTGDSYPNHHPKFQVDPAALTIAAEYFATLAEQALLRLDQETTGRTVGAALS